jgi:integrase
MSRKVLQRLVDDLGATPSAANHRAAKLSLLMKHAVRLDWIDHNPMLDVELVDESGGGFHSWDEQEVSAFEARHPLGTKARLALAIALYTAQRRADIVRAGPADLDNGLVKIRTSKTERTRELWIPAHPKLLETIDATPVIGKDTWLVTDHGKAFAPTSFGNWFRLRADEANLPHCTLHGLRKIAARRLAEAGCSPHEIMAITAHETLSEVERYTKGANQKKLARAAMMKLLEAGK